MSDILKVGESLRAPAQIVSSNGLNRLVIQLDGNLVLYTPRGARWDTGTWQLPATHRPNRLDMQGDGNLVLYNDQNFVAWSPNVHGKGGTRLVVQDDENVVLYRDDNSPVWHTQTGVAQPGTSEVTSHKIAEVAWARHTEVWSTLYRNGTLVVNTKNRCDAPFSGYIPNTFVVGVDGRGRSVWASQTLRGDTLGSLFDPFTASSGTDTFTEHWPTEIAAMITRLDIYPSDAGIYDKWREALKKAGEAADDLKEIYKKFWT